MAGQRPTRRGRAHREAFPALDILEAERSLREGGGACQWLDERGQIIGQGEMLALDGCQASFRYMFVGSANIARSSGALTLDVSGTRRNPTHVRQSFHCPLCLARVQKLFYVAGRWACGSCHDLVFLKQRLGAINKKIAGHDEMLVELLRLTTTQRNTRWFYNRQRHVERINRELVASGFTALPKELLYRTFAQWMTSGEAVTPVEDVLVNEHAGEQRPGLACLQPLIVEPKSRLKCKHVGSKVLHRPIETFLQQHKARQSVALEQDIVEGRVGSPQMSRRAVTTLLVERSILRPLALTSEWSAMAATINQDWETEFAISATYKGDPTLWPIGPDGETAGNPLWAILDDEAVTLKVRLPTTGKADPQADLHEAAEKLERRLAHVRDKFEQFNGTLGIPGGR